MISLFTAASRKAEGVLLDFVEQRHEESVQHVQHVRGELLGNVKHEKTGARFPSGNRESRFGEGAGAHGESPIFVGQGILYSTLITSGVNTSSIGTL